MILTKLRKEDENDTGFSSRRLQDYPGRHESQIAKSERYVLYASIENAANAEIACLRGSVDLILMDVCTADEESGLKAAAKIKQYNPKIKIIIMTSMPEHSFIQKAKACGCNGFWYKAVSYTHLTLPTTSRV